tara:strand:- start:2728 stop:2895 length:168 start_codon:yes stop_codon:yes gene_type:complete
MTKKEDQEGQEPKMTPEEIWKMRQVAETAISYDDAQRFLLAMKKFQEKSKQKDRE